jgi:tRNA(Ile2) C34 agmatinyltransferase TiaS
MVRVTFENQASYLYKDAKLMTKDLKMLIATNGKVKEIIKTEVNTCPDCGAELTPQGGCYACYHCGLSLCG